MSYRQNFWQNLSTKFIQKSVLSGCEGLCTPYSTGKYRSRKKRSHLSIPVNRLISRFFCLNKYAIYLSLFFMNPLSIELFSPFEKIFIKSNKLS